jgi:transposase
MATKSRERLITEWLDRIERSSLSPREYFAKYEVPFSLRQFYRYQKAFDRSGVEGLVDGRTQGNHRLIDAEAEGFLRWYVSAHEGVTRKDVHEALQQRFGFEITPRGLNYCLQRLGIHLERFPKPEQVAAYWSPYAGVELVVALAWHFGWPQATADVIRKSLTRARRSKRFAPRGGAPDLKGRNRRGEFTARYNRRSDVRRERFSSVEIKRKSKSLESMDLVKVSPKVIQRRCLAVLTLPFVTNNGEIRNVNTPRGEGLRQICGFQYKQPTLEKFLSELKYLGASEDLLRHQVHFWQERWQDEFPLEDNLPLLCYYVDGNTKALWSTKRVKKHKVTMLGRVMGCLEQVFIHDSYGRPLYFETFSGHAPMGEYILGLFEKIEESLEGPGPQLPVNRAVVMDGASNSVRTLRAFAAQNKYHYITCLDDNQWHPRKVRKEGRPQRYRHGAATLRDCEIELEDSQEKGYLFLTRAIKIEWDRGKKTYLATSLPKDIIGASMAVKAYFDRWPDEELPFKVMKHVACLNRVAGYGKQKLPDKRVQERQKQLASQIRTLKKELAGTRSAIEEEEAQIARLIPKERRLRARSRIVDGKRFLPRREAEELEMISRQITRHQQRVQRIRKAEPAYKKLERAEREWLRLQGKENVYKVDVELDQIMTYFRVSLVNLYAYLSKLMGGSHLSLVRLLYTVLALPGRIQENETSRRVELKRTQTDPLTMRRLEKAIEAINELNVHDGQGKRYIFALT